MLASEKVRKQNMYIGRRPVRSATSAMKEGAMPWITWTLSVFTIPYSEMERTYKEDCYCDVYF